MLKELIRNTKPEIFVSIQDDWLDTAGGETPARFVNLVWQWSDTNDNRASIETLGAIDDAPDGNFDIATLDYAFTDCSPHCSDVQHELWVKSCLDKEQCERMTDVFSLLGMPRLRMHYRARGASIQRLHNGRIETEMSIFDNTFLKVTV